VRAKFFIQNSKNEPNLVRNSPKNPQKLRENQKVGVMWAEYLHAFVWNDKGRESFMSILLSQVYL
jgi:hypothetical protein